LLQLLGLLVGFSPIVFFMCLFSWLRRSARKQEPRQEGSATEFPVASGMRFLFGLVVVLLAAFSVLVLMVALAHGDGVYAVLIPLVVLSAILLAKPMPVVLDHDGLRQHRWLGADREIAWIDIAWMKRGRNTGATYVRSKKGGRPISFSPLLVGQPRFEREVRAHIGGSED
jgi:hypothetical protein